jgi:hypothetical protein
MSTDDEQYMTLAAQSVLWSKRNTLSLDPDDILDLSNQIQREAQLFREASEAIRQRPNQSSHRKMDYILAQLKDEHLIESYTEAQNLKLDSDFVDLLRSEILRRGIHSLIYIREEIN